MAFLLALGTLFPLMNPFAALPVFQDLTQRMDDRGRNRTARITGVAVLVILVVAATLGRLILIGLGISVAALQVAGGIIVGVAGLAMVGGDSSRISPAEQSASGGGGGVAVVPLAIPMIASPGAISAVIAVAGRNPGLLGVGAVLGACLVMAVLVYVVLRFGDPLLARLGATGIGVLTRVFGLIILAIAVELIARGVAVLFPGLTH